MGWAAFLGDFFTNSSGIYICYDLKKIFSLKKIAKKLAFLTRNKAKLCKNFDHNIGF
jgi:GTPase SAR1 family protein